MLNSSRTKGLPLEKTQKKNCMKGSPNAQLFIIIKFIQKKKKTQILN